MSKKKDLTIDEYKDQLLDEIEDTTEFEPIVEYEEEYMEEKPEKDNHNKIKFIMNTVFIVLIVIMAMISVDVISVGRYSKGPYFAVKTKTHKDGGTKEYYGFGYKVIKYNQVEGRRDMEVGTWFLKYDTTAKKTSALDLAIAFTNNPSETYKKYYKKFLSVDGSFVSKDEKNNTLTLAYNDEDGKYNLDIVCTMAELNSLPRDLKENDSVTVIGTVINYEPTTEKQNKTLYMSDCFTK